MQASIFMHLINYWSTVLLNAPFLFGEFVGTVVGDVVLLSICSLLHVYIVNRL